MTDSQRLDWVIEQIVTRPGMAEEIGLNLDGPGPGDETLGQIFRAGVDQKIQEG